MRGVFFLPRLRGGSSAVARFFSGAALISLLALPLLAGCNSNDDRKNSEVAPPVTRPASIPQAPPQAQAAAQADMDRVKAQAERTAKEGAAGGPKAAK